MRWRKQQLAGLHSEADNVDEEFDSDLEYFPQGTKMLRKIQQA